MTPFSKNFRLASAAALAIFTISGCGEKAAQTQPSGTAAETEEAAPMTAADELAQLADRHAREVLEASPEVATFLGVGEEIAGEGFNGRLGEYGFEGNQRARSMNERFLQEIRGINRAALSGLDAITYDVLRHGYETAARRNQFDFGGATPSGSGGPYPVTQLTGPHIFLPSLLQNQHPLETAQDAEDYISRLSEFGRVFDELIESIGGDAALGVAPPRFAVEGAINVVARFTESPPADNPLATTFSQKISTVESLTDDDKEALNARVVEAVEAVVYPAYARLSAALENITDQTNNDAGVWRLGEEGEAFYTHALDSYGASGMSGEDIHQLGLADVERITAEMDAIFDAEGLTEGTVAERFEAIGARDDMRYPNTDEGRAELLADLNVQVADIMAKAPDWFGTIPSQPVEVRRIPDYEQDSAPGGYYTPPPIEGERPGIYWINLKDTADWPKHTLQTLTYHEAVPGHHFQVALELAAGLPIIRNVFFYSEFAEGWALYAEQVAAEMGMYADDPEGNLGRLQSELFRAARLVVDSGLHHKRWTREEAIDYMVGVTGDTRASITREIERYSVWPGQACSYKLGMIKINELRNKAETELGDAFDLRAFHDEILLTGSMPLPVLEKKIDAWIAAKKAV